MAAKTLDWKEIVEKAGLTPEQKAQAEALFGVEGLTKLIQKSAGEIAASEYEGRRTELEASWNRANTEYLAMQDKLANHEATVGELEQAKEDLATATERLKAAAPNIDLDKLKNDIVAVVRSEAQTLEVGRGAMEIDAIECVAAHRELFGQSLSVRQLITDALAAKKPVAAYWEEKYNVPAKRDEIAKAAHDKEIQDATNAGYQRAMSEREHPGTRPLAESKSPFWVPKADKPTEGIQPWDETAAPAEERALLTELQTARAQA
jgi:hypothetical protein